MPTPVPSVDLLPTPPSTTDPANFDTRADDFLGALPGFQTQTNAIATNVFTNADEALSSANTAVTASSTATDAALVAASAANFKGLWNSLTGALNKPAAVKHNGRFWYLLNNLANVAASEPSGTNPDWTTGDGGVITQRVSANTNMVAGIKYVATTSGITLTAPASFISGDTLTVSNVTAALIIVDFNGNSVKGVNDGLPMNIPPYRGFSLTYDGVTLA